MSASVSVKCEPDGVHSHLIYKNSLFCEALRTRGVILIFSKGLLSITVALKEPVVIKSNVLCLTLTKYDKSHFMAEHRQQIITKFYVVRYGKCCWLLLKPVPVQLAAGSFPRENS